MQSEENLPSSSQGINSKITPQFKPERERERERERVRERERRKIKGQIEIEYFVFTHLVCIIRYCFVEKSLPQMLQW